MSQALYNKLRHIWKSASAWPDYQEVMRLALTAGQTKQAAGEEQISRWSALSTLCCQAAGGNPQLTGDITLAWLLFYAAAHLMDSVQDGDEPDAWWAERGIGVALSAATGLYFSGSQALMALHDNPKTRNKAVEIIRHFNATFLVMSSGQYADLSRSRPSLEDYWKLAQAKSGAFFSLAGWAGAYLGTDDADVSEEYARFGRHLGLLVQIKDDLDDLQAFSKNGAPCQRVSFLRSLPVIYTLQCASPALAQLLKEYIMGAPDNPYAAQEAIKLLDECGAAEYIHIEMEQHKTLALAALDKSGARSPAAEELAGLVKDQ